MADRGILSFFKNKGDSKREKKIEETLKQHPNLLTSDMMFFDPTDRSPPRVPTGSEGSWPNVPVNPYEKNKAGFTDPEGLKYLTQRAGKGGADAATSWADVPRDFANAGIRDLDYFTSGGLSGGTYEPFQFGEKSFSDRLSEGVTDLTGADIVPPERVTPGVQRAGQAAEIGTSIVADPLNWITGGAGAVKGPVKAAEKAADAVSDVGRATEAIPPPSASTGSVDDFEKAASRPRGPNRNTLPTGNAYGPDYDPYAVRKPEKGDLAEIIDKSENGGGLSPKQIAAANAAKRKEEALSKPSIVTNEDKLKADKIFEHAAEVRSPEYPFATDPIFGPADPKLTKELVPQRSIASQLPPKPTGEGKLPKNDRARPILENEEEIGQQLARWLEADPTDPLPFYSTGSVIQGLVEKGELSMEEAIKFMRDWAGQGAATSPRTATPQNLRNAGYLLYRNATGDRLTKLRQAQERESGLHGFPKTHNTNPFNKKGEPIQANLNRPGFAMMGMHTQLGDEFLKGTVDPWNNPKPYTFRENWSGNMADATADTHNIRAVLDAYDKLMPGGIPRGWFKSDMAYDNYIQGGGFPDEGQLNVGAIEDGLQGAQIGGRYAQTEYPIMQGPTNAAARILGISPAEVQERTWFTRGPRTGLQSPRMAIPDLFNAQIEQTAKVLGISQEEVLKLFARHRIPLAETDVSDVPGYSTTA